MDTSTLEHIAEDKITYELQRNDLLVAKPKNDRLGTDLLVFAEIKDGVKFCRAQSKGRSLINSNTSNITVPKDYVTNGFILFLYLEVDSNTQNLYLFLPPEIREWSVNSSNKYQLNISKSSVLEKLEFFLYDSSKVELIKTIIKNAEIHDEFRGLIRGVGNVQAQPATGSGKGTVS